MVVTTFLCNRCAEEGAHRLAEYVPRYPRPPAAGVPEFAEKFRRCDTVRAAIQAALPVLP